MERLLDPPAGPCPRTADPSTDVGWIERQARVLFIENERGRLVSTREAAPSPAPRFWLGRTRIGNVWRFRCDLDGDTLRRLARYAAREDPLPADWVSEPDAMPRRPRPPERWDAIQRTLESRAPIERVWRGPAFRFPHGSPGPIASPSSRRVRLATPTDGGRLAASPGFEWLADELGALAPCALALEDDLVVGACWSSRTAPDAAEAGVETRAERRGCGVARATVSAWARAVRDAGREPLYSTSWENAGSLGVARSLGLVAYGEDLHLT